MRSMRVKGMDIDTANITPSILNNNLDYLANGGREDSRDGVNTLILMCSGERREEQAVVLIQGDEVRFSWEGLNPW